MRIVISGTAKPNPEGEEMAMPSDKPIADWMDVHGVNLPHLLQNLN